jgi:predicted RNA-binding protein YlxR (DUF448 family)
VGCGRVTAKQQLLRLAVAGDRVVADTRAIMPGRGAYVCGRECASAAVRRRALQRAFRRSNISLDPVELDHAAVPGPIDSNLVESMD